MKKLILMVIAGMFILTACESLDGTTTEDNEKVKEDQVVDMSGK